MKKEIIKINESQLQNIIENEIRNVLNLNEADYIKYPKYRTPYDDKKKSEYYKQPLKNGVNLYDIRARLGNIRYALKEKRLEDAFKQAGRLYKMVDYMINQGYYVC